MKTQIIKNQKSNIMKNVFMAMSIVAVSLSACKKAPIQTTESQSIEISSEAISYYCNGVPVSLASDITNLTSPERMIVATDQIHGKLGYYFFDNPEMAEAYLSKYETMTEVVKNIHTATLIGNYAKQIGEAEHYAQTGSMSAEFIKYQAQFESRKRVLQGTLYNNVAFGGGFINKTLGFGIAMLPAGINNNTESVRFAGPGVGPYILYDGFFYGGPAFVVAANMPTLWPIPFANIASSVF